MSRSPSRQRDDARRRDQMARVVAASCGAGFALVTGFYLLSGAPIRSLGLACCWLPLLVLAALWPRTPASVRKALSAILLLLCMVVLLTTDASGGTRTYLVALAGLLPTLFTWRERATTLILVLVTILLVITDVSGLLHPVIVALGDPPVPQSLHIAAMCVSIVVIAAGITWMNFRIDVHEVRLQERSAALQEEAESNRRLAAELDQALEAARSAAIAKDRFLANMSHEIRTPLAAVISLNDLARDAEDPEDRDEYLDLIASSSRHLLEVLNDVLDLSKLESGNLQLERVATDVRTTLDEVVRVARLRADGQGLTITASIDLGVHPWRISDPMRLKQILHNLLSNAIKFTEQGTVQLTVTSTRERVRFEVADTGIGMTPEQVARATEPFHQAEASTSRRFGGTGLGLSVCNGILAHCGEQLHITSTPGQGTTVSFEVPMPAARPVSTHQTVPPSLPIGRPVRVLLVEDNPVNQLIASRLVGQSSAEVAVADNGQQAVERFRDGFDLILMDMQMPVMDGLTATREIRRLEREEEREPVRIVALTANALNGDEDACRDAGMDGYMTKPLDPAQLCRLLQRVALRPAA